MKILTVPNDVLKKKSTPVEKLDKQLVDFILNLEETLRTKKNPEGVGLSAPQIGKNWRIFSTYLDKGMGREIRTYINPRITKASSKMSIGPNSKKPFLEGCLSIPDIYGPVWRHFSLVLEYEVLDLETLNLKTLKTKFDSFPARVIQHEYDHLEGVLFTERALEQGLPLYQEKDGELVEIK